ncbi:MAG: hypothetical protein Q9214_006208 [Letrouitia sp. 1 TL-2023]
MSTGSDQFAAGIPILPKVEVQPGDAINITTTRVTRLVLRSPNTPIINILGTVYYSTSNLEIWSDDPRYNLRDNSIPGVAGSYKPASVDVSLKTTILIVYLRQDPSVSSIAFQLIGDLHGRVVVNASPCYAGLPNPVALSTKHAGIPWGYAGDIQWSLIHPKTKERIPLNQTRVEIYGLSSYLPPFFKNPGTPVKFLRYIALPEPKTDYRSWVATTCMTDFWFRYDTFNGKPRFASSPTGVGYKFNYWLSTIFTRLTVNCYDQAGIVQLAYSLQVGNPQNTWAYMAPYGFINKTQLVGEGQSNNPFYRQQLAIRCIDGYDPRRTQFGNHAFIISGGLVMDSTCGPHTGNETPPAYVSAAIDNSRPSGTSANIRMYQGITTLVGGSSAANAAPPSTFPDPIMDAVDRAMEKGLVPHPPPVRFSNAHLAALGPLLVDGFSFRQKYQSTDIGDFGSETRYIFRLDDATYTLSASICADHQAAISAIRQHLATYQMPLDDLFTRPAPGTQKGQINLEGENVIVWVRGDTFLVLDVDSTNPDIKSVAKRVDDFIDQSAVENPALALAPVLSSLPEPTAPVDLGSEFTISPLVDDVGVMQTVVEHGHVLLLSNDQLTKTFKFLALTPGEEAIFFYFAHPQSLRTVSGMVNVTVQGSV